MLTIRSGVQPPDIERLVAVLHDAEEDDELIRAAVTNAGLDVYSARLDDRVVAAAVVDWSREPDSEIIYIAVDSEVRGQGHGRAMVEHLMREVDVRGGRLVVGTGNSSLDNIAFYQRCGFRMRAVKRGYFDYVQPEVTEFGIVLRDMIVFAYEGPGVDSAR